VSPQENYSWKNADGTMPQGMVNTGNHAATFVQSINKKDIDDFVAAQGENAVFSIDLVR
jgi:type IV secretory pathway component VirB8